MYSTRLALVCMYTLVRKGERISSHKCNACLQTNSPRWERETNKGNYGNKLDHHVCKKDTPGSSWPTTRAKCVSHCAYKCKLPIPNKVNLLCLLQFILVKSIEVDIWLHSRLSFVLFYFNSKLGHSRHVFYWYCWERRPQVTVCSSSTGWRWVTFIPGKTEMSATEGRDTIPNGNGVTKVYLTWSGLNQCQAYYSH